MPKKTQRVERLCLVCDATFEGTPKATRCKSCKDAGRKVPSNIQRERYANSGSSNGVPKNRACIECGDQFSPLSLDHRFCPSCTDMLGLEADSVKTPEKPTDEDGEFKYLSRFEQDLIAQQAYLDAREKPPKDYPNMTQRTATTPLGILWVQLCSADGAASSIMYAAEPRDLTEDNKVKLLTTFFRLRAKGYHPSAIAKLCPRSILKDEPQAALKDLPPVTEQEPQDIHEWDQIAARANLGLL